MKRDHINYFLIGLFVLAMVAAFFVFMYFVTGRSGPMDEYFVRYKNVSGLKFGTGVFYEGYRVGQIEKIVPQPTTSGMEYALTLHVAQGWQIPDDSVARVVASGLISAVKIEINEGSSATMLTPGAEISGHAQPGIFALLSQAAGEFQDLSQHGVMPVLKNLNLRIDEVASEIIDFQREELKPLVSTFNERVNKELIGDAQVLLTRLDRSAQQLEKILGAENQEHIGDFLVHMDDVAVNLNELITRIELTRVQMGDTLATLGSIATENDVQLGSAIKNANVSMIKMREALDTINEYMGSIMYNVDGGTHELHEFAKGIRDNPTRLIRGAGQVDAQ